MEFLSLAFLMLVAILASNLINRFVPSVSAPVIQIALGALIGIAPLPFHLVLNPEWFFVIFIAPLLFYDGVMANKRVLWTLRRPILLLAFGLVFLTVVLVGYLTDLLIPSMPLAAAFALAAAVTPTDAVAVGALGKRIHIPHRIMHLLEGESLINDASGLVSFQFAVAAMLTGAFSLVDAGAELVLVVVGGVLVGAVITLLRTLLVRWVRSWGMEDVTFHILVGVLTPFVVYLVAEHAGVSGILAVVTAGILQSFQTRRTSPETVFLRVTTESVWTTIVYVLNGLVFVILGTQLPDIIESVRFMAQIDQRIVVLDIAVIMLALLTIRFVWAYFTLDHGTLAEDAAGLSRSRASTIVSIAGVRGAVTLASTMSLPFLLPDGSLFPFRETLIFISSIVILVSLLLANFVLPLLVGKPKQGNSVEDETIARLDVLQGVVRQMSAQTTPENQWATSNILRDYFGRIGELEAKQGWSRTERDAEAQMRAQALEWEQEHTLAYIAEHHTDPAKAEELLEIIEAQRRGRTSFLKTFSKRTMRVLAIFRGERYVKGTDDERIAQRRILADIMESNDLHVIDKLRALEGEVDTRVLNKVLADYEFALALLKQRMAYSNGDDGRPASDTLLIETASQALQYERDGIQRVFEEGRVSRTTAAEMRNNVDLLGLRLQKELFLGADDAE